MRFRNSFGDSLRVFGAWPEPGPVELVFGRRHGWIWSSAYQEYMALTPFSPLLEFHQALFGCSRIHINPHVLR